MNELIFLNRALGGALISERDVGAVLSFNKKTAARGLVLSKAEAVEAVKARSKALYENSRVEVGIGALGRLIETFSQSTFATPEGWAELVCFLTEEFYYIKTETHDRISDFELIRFMFDSFENFCGGSTDLLADQCDGLITRLNGGKNTDTEEALYGNYTDMPDFEW